jgi:hypothetical protein
VLLRWCSGQKRISIFKSIKFSQPTIRKNFNNLILKMKEDNLKLLKFGGPGAIVQVD